MSEEQQLETVFLEKESTNINDIIIIINNSDTQRTKMFVIFRD